MSRFTIALKVAIDSLTRIGQAPQYVQCGSDEMREKISSALEELGLDLTIIVDYEAPRQSYVLLTERALEDLTVGIGARLEKS